MPNKHQDFIIQGMVRDSSEHVFDSKFAYENQNMRITANPNSDSTHTSDMIAMTNEKGNKYTSITGLKGGNMTGVPVGQCLINEQWVIFMVDKPSGTTDEEIRSGKDRIYRLWLENGEMFGELLYEGHLNFDYRYPLETLPYYENEQIQKVYWTDGINQPRFINIVEKPEKRAKWNDTYFDFVATINTTSTTINILEKTSGGNFPAGVIQWFFTYSRQFGPESNIFASTELKELKHPDKGAAPDETTTQSFVIRLEYLDDSFDFVNVYSVIRTSLDNVPIAKRVATVPIDTYSPAPNVVIPFISVTDNNLSGTAIDPQELFYKGGESISAYTIEQKNNTLFLGNYKLLRPYIPELIAKELKNKATIDFKFLTPPEGSNKLRDYSRVIKGHPFYRYGNTYRIGVQFQHTTGRWSEAIWLGDYRCNAKLELKWTGYEERYAYAIPYGQLTMDGNYNEIVKQLIQLGYVKARPLVVYPNASERKFVAQGVLSNTITFSQTDKNRYPDYFFRFFNKDYNEYRKGIFSADRKWYRKKCVFNPTVANNKYFTEDEYAYNSRHRDDNNVIMTTNDTYSLYSPDIEYDDSYKVAYNDKTLRLSLSGCINVIANKKSLSEVETSTISKPTVGHNAWLNPTAKEICYNCWNNVSASDIKKYQAHYSSAEEGGIYHYDKEVSTFRLYWDNRLTSFEEQPYSICTQSDEKEYYTFDAKYPERIPKGFSMGKETGYHYVGGYLWNDTFQNVQMRHLEDTDTDVPNGASSFMQYFWQWIYPVSVWQASGSICYDQTSDASSVLKSNKILNYFDALAVNYVESSSMPVKVFTSYGDNVQKIKNDEDPILYSKRVDNMLNWEDYYTAVMYFTKHGTFSWNLCGERHYVRHTDFDSFNVGNINEFNKLPYDGVSEDKGDAFNIATATRGFNWTTARENPSGDAVYLKRSAVVRYDSVPHFVIQCDNISDILCSGTYIPVCDIENPDVSNLFGGTTIGALQTNSFLIAGKDVNLINSSNVPRTEYGSFNVEWTIGDVYLREYECLKTYPLSFGDENCVTEILKVPLQTYYNLDGRYDTWKDNPTFATSPANWNLMNPIYNQKNNFFVYHGLDLSANSVDSFPNSVTWTRAKWSGESIDKWTQITLASSIDVDGSKGEITKLVKLHDNLLCFQPRGMSQILYNEREQIATGSGVPIELANSGKVSGVRYVTEKVGCNNKWSICKTESGLYWIDDENKAIMAWNQQLANLSDSLGFHSWINDMSTLDIWNPVDFKSFVTYYDPYYESVMFFFKGNMLSYNVQLNCFDSFFSYGYVPYYEAFEGTAFTLSDKDSQGKDTYKVWEQHKGNYNYFYVHDHCIYDDGIVKCRGRYDINGLPTEYGYEPYWTTVLVNSDMPYDKVFNNFDMRTDMWNTSGNLLEETFSHVEVWNEFQHNKSRLIRQVDVPKIHLPAQHSILKKKFRVWYANIPRDTKVQGSRYYNRDRMRNTWLYLKLSKELIDDDKALDFPYISDNKHVIHHIGVSYFV